MSEASVPSIELARAAVAGRRWDEALRMVSARLEVDPGDMDALEVKAVVETERGDHAAAECTLRRAIVTDPTRRWPYNDLARLLSALVRNEEAEAVMRAALEADTDNADAHAMLGSLLVGRSSLVPGIAHLERAIALIGRHPALTGALGHALLRQGRLDDARPLLEETVAADPNALSPIAHLAELEERAGRFDTAREHLDRAERLAKAQGRDMLLQRATLLTRTGAWRDALALLDAQPVMAGPALLERGRLRDRAGRHEEAWADWMAGKTQLAVSAGRTYPAEEVAGQADALTAFFTGERMARLPRAQTRTDIPQPIFIVGFPRSGTTLVEQIMASHSAIRAGGELPFGRDLREAAAVLAGGEPAFPSGLATVADGWTTRLRDLYLARAEQHGLTAPGAVWFTDKMPLNDLWLPLLRLAFPASPVLLVRRHPLDVLVSVMAHDMTHGFNCGYRLEDAARHFALVDDTGERYREAGIAMHEVGYERLVANQQGETENLMTAIGLPMEPAQLRFYERETVSPTPSYAQVREPLNDRSIGRWRHHERALASIRSFVEPALARRGYA